MATSTSPDIVNAETDARFYAQSGFAAGRKLDPSNPTDKPFIHVWNDIHRKVQAEADKGTLVTTFDHPAVAQSLSDAAVAHQAAAMHADAAVVAPDAATQQQHIASAATASQVSSLKSREASRHQPPTVDPELVKDASKEVAKNPPPAQAPASEHIAHEHASTHAPGHAQEVHAQATRDHRAAAQSRAALYHETDLRFARLGYKPGKKLDMSIARDREMADVWRSIFQQVQREAAEGTLVLTTDQPPPSAPLPPSVSPAPPFVPPATPPFAGPPPMQPAPPMQPRPPMVPPAYPYPPMQPRPPMATGPGPGMGPMQPFPPMGPVPRGRGDHGHGHGRGRGGGGVTPAPGGAPPGAFPGAPAPSPGAPAPSDAGAPPADTSAAPSGGGETSAPESESHVGKYLAIGIGVLVAGGLAYYAVKHKSSTAPRTRSRSPKVYVASPASSAARAYTSLPASRP